ncbi:MAG: hypothetical protein HZA53_04065 [Planctomycetes bacterium]|nr:hypothetical protein [Planctomycetota bacterium]
MHSIRSALLSSLAVVAGLFVVTSSAAAQCASPSTGPDVICGDLNGVQNYTASGTLEALALGTTSCNMGNVDLNWIQNTVNHPLMTGGAYKYKVVSGSGRFEELGIAWCKHAFAAFQENVCCTCSIPGGLLQVLHPGCSDPYTPARNGTQSGLGPRYQVNPNTGAYLASHPVPSGGNNGRIQMDVSTLETNSASVRYFGEMQYIALDDARNNNNDNNTSYRELSVTGSGTAWTFGTIGSTVRTKGAIEAWKVVDPTVTLTPVTVPESSIAPYDGNARMMLAFKTTSLGGGQWHYEYALYNQNSDRGVQAFSVPMPAGVNVTNIGFHDVDYRGGDGEGGVNRDGTDWVGTVSGGALTWATTLFSVNANANALRFGTTYNFRFDADQPPTAVNLTLTQYKVVNNVVVAGVDGPSTPVVPPVFTSFCSGDGTLLDHTTPCPCANIGAAGNGCANSVNAAGANLTATGTAAADNVVLNGSGMPAVVSCIYLQGDSPDDTVFGDGTRCAGGALIRLRTKNNVGGASSFPDSTDTITLSARGGVTVGSGALRYYQTYYRNSAAAFCPPETFNVTNGWKIAW